MWKNHKKAIIFTALLCLLPTVAGLLLWNRLPEQIPTHFSFDNTANGWSGKAFVVFGYPALMAGVELLCVLFIDMDPKKQNINRKVFLPVLWIMPVLSCLCMSISYASALEKKLDVSLFVLMALGIIMIVLGNFMPKAQQNYTIGIKVPWALNDEENWNRTHRVAGYTFTVGGILVILAAFLHITIWVPLAITLFSTLIPTAYSYYLYAKKHS